MFAYKFTCFYIDIFRDEVSPMYPKFSCRVHQVVLQRLARPEHRLTPSLRRASAAVDAAGRSLERWVRRLELEFAGENHHNSKVPLDSMMCFYSWMPKNQLENDDQLRRKRIKYPGCVTHPMWQKGWMLVFSDFSDHPHTWVVSLFMNRCLGCFFDLSKSEGLNQAKLINRMCIYSIKANLKTKYIQKLGGYWYGLQ